MFQSVSVSANPTTASVENLYIKKLISVADVVLAKHRFGIAGKVDRLAFIKIKSLLPYLRNDIQTTSTLNEFISAINNK